MRKIAVEIGDADEKYCGKNCLFRDGHICGLPKHQEVLEWSEFAKSFLRTDQCNAAEIREKVCKWEVGNGEWFTGCGRYSYSKHAYCQCCGGKVE